MSHDKACRGGSCNLANELDTDVGGKSFADRDGEGATWEHTSPRHSLGHVENGSRTDCVFVGGRRTDERLMEKK